MARGVDNKGMYKAVLLLALMGVALWPADGYRLIYREQLYELYHQHQVQYPYRIVENIFRLQQVLRADFANPLYALARIEDQKEWRRYRMLFNMHINLKLTELHLQLGGRYFKFKAYFYNWPWRRQNLESLGYAESYIEAARGYWREAQRWSKEAWEQSGVHLEEIQNWLDENWRIENGRLDYDAIIDRHLARLEGVREQFEGMDENTY